MKIKSPSTPKAVPRPPTEKPATAAAAPAEKGWKPKAASQAGKPPPASLESARKTVAAHATEAVAQVIAAQSATPGAPVTAKHPLLERFGEALGMGLGVIVTEALSAVPSWNKPVLDAQGKPVASVEGADRVGNHDILKRHQEVVGPQVAALVNKLSPGVLHDLLEGLGKGATAAPGTSYRLEAKVSDLLTKR